MHHYKIPKFVASRLFFVVAITTWFLATDGTSAKSFVYTVEDTPSRRTVAVAQGGPTAIWLTAPSTEQQEWNEIRGRDSELVFWTVDFSAPSITRSEVERLSLRQFTIEQVISRPGYLEIDILHKESFPEVETFVFEFDFGRWDPVDSEDGEPEAQRNADVPVANRSLVLLETDSLLLSFVEGPSTADLSLRVFYAPTQREIRFSFPVERGTRPLLLETGQAEQGTRRPRFGLMEIQTRDLIVIKLSGARVFFLPRLALAKVIAELRRNIDLTMRRISSTGDVSLAFQSFLALDEIVRLQDGDEILRRTMRYLSRVREYFGDFDFAYKTKNDAWTLYSSLFRATTFALPTATLMQASETVRVHHLPGSRNIYQFLVQLRLDQEAAQELRENVKDSDFVTLTDQENHRIAIGLPPFSSVELAVHLDSLSSLELDILQLSETEFVVVSEVSSTQTMVFEKLLATGLNVRLVHPNRTLFVNGERGRYVIPAVIQVPRDTYERDAITADYQVTFLINSKMMSLMGSDVFLEFRYQNQETQAKRIDRDVNLYMFRTRAERDSNGDIIYKYQYRLRHSDSATPWRMDESPVQILK